VPYARKSERREQKRLREQFSQTYLPMQLYGQFGVAPGAPLPQQRLPAMAPPLQHQQQQQQQQPGFQLTDGRGLPQQPRHPAVQQHQLSQLQQEQQPKQEPRAQQEGHLQRQQQEQQLQLAALTIPPPAIPTPATAVAGGTGTDPRPAGSLQSLEDPVPTLGDQPNPLLDSHAPSRPTEQELLSTSPDLASSWTGLPDGPSGSDESAISQLAALEFAELEVRYARLEQARDRILAEMQDVAMCLVLLSGRPLASIPLQNQPASSLQVPPPRTTEGAAAPHRGGQLPPVPKFNDP
jgi:hypothetical protein